MACVVKSRPAELSSCRVGFSENLWDEYGSGILTGWAEKRERGAMKTEAQTVAVSWKLVSEVGGLTKSRGQRTIQMPAWAIIAVPGGVRVSICMACLDRKSRCTEDEVELYAFSLFL